MFIYRLRSNQTGKKDNNKLTKKSQGIVIISIENKNLIR